MNKISGIKLLVVLASICLVTATAANAATIEFRILTNGVDTPTYTGATGLVNLAIQVRTIGAVFYDDATFGAYLSGVTQYSFDLQDSTGISGSSILSPKQGTLPTPPFLPNGKWAATASTGFTRIPGQANATKAGVGTFDVLGETGSIPNGDLGTYGMTYGGGAGLPSGTTVGPWATVVTGQFNYAGGAATLTLFANPLAQTLFDGATGVYLPASTITDSVAFGASNQPPSAPNVNPTEITEASWTKQPGWNNPAHSVDVTAASIDPDGNPLTYEWKMTKPGGGSVILGTTGPALHLTLADIASLGLPAYVGADDPSYHWTLSVRANDGTVFGDPTNIPTFVPEPATIGMLSFGIVGALLRRRRRA